MWNGYIDFYHNVDSGNLNFWWSQHNDHRILLSRLFFWADINWLQGRGISLIVLNYVLMFLIYFILLRLINEQKKTRFRFISFFVLAWLFSYCQKENFVWGFQNQFFLAQLFPILSFYLFYLAHKKNSNYFFLASQVFGILSIFTMANGVFVMPLMLIYSWLLEFKPRKDFLMFIGTCFSLGLFFYHYTFADVVLSHRPVSSFIKIISYLPLYFGGPFFFFLGKSYFAKLVSFILGGVFLSALFFFMIKNKKEIFLSAYKLMILTMLSFFVISSISVALGRSEISVQSRYMTPVLIAWALLFILFLPSFYNLKKIMQRKIKIAFLVLLILMTPTQLSALINHDDTIFNRQIGSLALEMGVRDHEKIRHLLFNENGALEIAERAKQKHLSIFGIPPLRDLHSFMNQEFDAPSNLISCPGKNISDDVNSLLVEKDNRFYRIKGYSKNFVLIQILNNEHQTVGFGLQSNAHQNKQDDLYLFEGYLSAESLNKNLNQFFVFNKKDQCLEKINISISH